MPSDTQERFTNGVFFEQPEDADLRFKNFGKTDPYPEIVPSLLNSADIYQYVIATGMLAPFYPASLKSASYEASLLGPLIWWKDDREPHYQELRQDEPFDLAPNSIAFVSVEPTFRIPYYIALRFNLRITHIHRGLLLGTGPLIDPGFVGKLVIPLHNLTDKSWRIVGGEPLIWIEFTKLSRNILWDRTQPALLGRKDYVPFPEDKKNKDFFWYLEKAQNGARPVRPIRASVGNFEGELKSTKEKAERTAEVVRRVEIVGVLAILVAAVLGVPPVLSLIQESNQYLNEARSELQAVDRRSSSLDNQIKALQAEFRSAQKDRKDLNERIDRIEHAITKPEIHSLQAAGKPKRRD